MGHALNIADSRGTIAFRATSEGPAPYNKVLDYVPRSPELTSLEYEGGPLSDGGEIPVTRRRNVTETARVHILGGPATTNLVANPSFETGTAGWVPFGGGQISRQPTYARYGHHSLRVVAATTGDGAENAAVVCTAGSPYALSLWLYRTDVTTSIYAYLQDYVADWDYTSVKAANVLGWQRLALTRTMRPGSTDWKITICTMSVGTTTFYVDGVQLEPGAVVTPYCDGDQGGDCSWAGTPHASTSARLGGTDAARAVVNALERKFRQAELHQANPAVPAVYVEVRAADAGDCWRSEILNGRLELTDGWMGWQWDNTELQCDLTWTRRWYWEGSPRAPGYSNRHGTIGYGGVPAGVLLYNDDDATHDNYLTLAGTAASESMPAPLTLQYEPGTAVAVTTLYVGLSQWANAAAFPWSIQGERAAGAVTPSTAVASASASGGSIGRSGYSTAGTAQRMFQWNLTGAEMSAGSGNWFVPVVRLGVNGLSGSTIRWEWIDWLDNTTYWTSPEYVLTTDAIQDTPAVPWPPTLAGVATAGTLALQLWAKRATAGTLDIDLLTMIPTDSGYRKYTTNVGPGTSLVDDTEMGLVYHEVGGSALPYPTVVGAPLQLVPNRTGRLVVLAKQSAEDRTLAAGTVTLEYRPRRLTL